MSSSGSPVRGGESYRVSPAELQVFVDHAQNSLSKKNPIVTIAEAALKNNVPAEFSKSDWDVYKRLERNFLGPHADIETFQHLIGDEPPRLLRPTRQFDLIAFKNLMAPWANQRPKDLEKNFKVLEPYEQKLLLKAFAHFSETKEPMQEGSQGVSEKDVMILLMLIAKVKRLSGSGPYPTDVKYTAFYLFRHFYGLYKGAALTDKENELATKTDLFLTDCRDAKRKVPDQRLDEVSLTYPQGGTPSFLRKKEVFKVGETRIAKEIENDFRHLSHALSNLKARFDRRDPTVGKDLIRYFEKCKMVQAKSQTLVELYKPYLEDKDLTFLCSKALAGLSELRALEADVLYMMDQVGAVSRFGGIENPLQVRESASDYLSDAFNLASRAHFLGQPKACVLVSKLMRLQSGPNLTREDLDFAQKAFETSMPSLDPEVLEEYGKLKTEAWLYGVQETKEDDLIELAQSLRGGGADLLREHFEAGSAKAGVALIEELEKKLKPEAVRDKFDRFIASIYSLFSYGSASILGQEPFLSNDRHRFSQGEIDFLIKAGLFNIKGSVELLEKAIKKGFGPKVPLEQALSFLKNLDKEQDPFMVVNGREAYRYFEFAAQTVLTSKTLHETQRAFAHIRLVPYLEKEGVKRTYAYELLKPLADELAQPLVATPPFTVEEAAAASHPEEVSPEVTAVVSGQKTLWEMFTSMWSQASEAASLPQERDQVEPVHLVMSIPFGDSKVDLPVQTTDSKAISILTQMATLLNEAPSAERYLAACRLAAPLIARLEFSAQQYTDYMQSLQPQEEGEGGVVRIKSVRELGMLAGQSIQNFIRATPQGLVMDVAVAALTALALTATQNSGGVLPVVVARGVGALITGARFFLGY